MELVFRIQDIAQLGFVIIDIIGIKCVFPRNAAFQYDMFQQVLINLFYMVVLVRSLLHRQRDCRVIARLWQIVVWNRRCIVFYRVSCVDTIYFDWFLICSLPCGTSPLNGYRAIQLIVQGLGTGITILIGCNGQRTALRLTTGKSITNGRQPVYRFPSLIVIALLGIHKFAISSHAIRCSEIRTA